MTEAEIKAAVAASNMPEAQKALLIARAIAGDAGARFAVFGLAKRAR